MNHRIAALVLGIACVGTLARAGAPLQFQQLSAGGSNTCAVDTAGGVECWGQRMRAAMPTKISFNGATATRVSTGPWHSCAIVGAGLQCWGDNAFGQLGDGSTDASDTPVAVVGLAADVTDVATADWNTCVVAAGGVHCWGNNQYGQLGNGEVSQTPTLTPGNVVGLDSGVTAIAMARASACAIVNGAVKCWGSNVTGELGDGTFFASAVPVDVVGLGSSVTALSGGANTFCAIVAGAARCWGAGDIGQLGNGGGGSAVPVDVVGLDADVTSIGVGDGLVCATRASTDAFCWGYSLIGGLGTGSYNDFSWTPAQTSIVGPGLASIDAGNGHACVLKDAQAYCWGANDRGQLGLGTSSLSSYDPVPVIGLQDGVTQLSASDEGVCAVRSGLGYCWGDNRQGQVGDGTIGVHGAPSRLAGLSGVSTIAANAYPGCAVADGMASCWGSEYLGNGSLAGSLVPVAVDSLDSGVSGITAGYLVGCAVRHEAALCWGDDFNGTLGDGLGTGIQLSPVAVSGLDHGVASISAGYRHVCAVVSGAAQCWGGNDRGQVGNGSAPDPSFAPATVPGLETGVTQVVARSDYSCAVKNGGAWCWGGNDLGRLGNGSYDDAAVPRQVAGLATGVASISLGGLHACALMVDRSVKCWGSNYTGELGTAAVSSSPVPVLSESFPAHVDALALGLYTTCGTADGAVFCVGWNAYGQLGNGGVPFVATPTPVLQNDALFEDGFELP
jgi:alpha-tubulin suppressor-like RCC1 family protein